MTRLAVVLLFGLAAARGQVVLNELDTATPDYVELRNLSASPVDVSGWTVQSYRGSSLQVETPYTLPAGTTISGGGTLVLEENGAAGQAGTLGPCATRTGSNYNWGASTTIIVVLLDAQGLGQDYVWRNASQIPGAPPNLPAGTSWTGNLFTTGRVIRRIGDIDTDDASDWVVSATPTPCALNPGQSTPVPPQIVDLTLATMGLGDASFALTTSPPLPGLEYFGLYSMQDYTPNGSGPFFGIGFDALPFLFLPLVPASPFHSTLDSGGAAAVSYPPGTLTTGVFFEGRVVILDPTSGGVLVSDVAEINL